MNDTRRGGPERFPRPDSSMTSGGMAPDDAAPGSPDAAGLALQARDRVLLYTRGMELDPVRGVEIALESLRRAVSDREPEHPLGVAEAMRALRAVLAEHGLKPEVEAPGGGRLVSGPPLQRSPMVPASDTWSLRGRIRRRP